jgi:hypothetical protein
MQVGSLVEYIGGQDQRAKQIFTLLRNTPYVVTFISEGKYLWGVGTAIHLDCAPPEYGFHPRILRELAPPEEISIDKILEEPQLV